MLFSNKLGKITLSLLVRDRPFEPGFLLGDNCQVCEILHEWGLILMPDHREELFMLVDRCLLLFVLTLLLAHA